MDFTELPSLITNTDYSTTDSVILPEVKQCQSLVENVRPVIHSNFIVHTAVRNNRTYIDLQFILATPAFASQQAELLLMAQQQALRQNEASTPNKSVRTSPQARNYKEIQGIFQFIVSALGLTSAKPREILSMMPPEYNLELNTLAYMLQRYRVQLLKEHNLQNISQIRNFHHLKAACKMVKDVCLKWLDSDFTGLNREQIYAVLSSQ